MNIKTTNPLLLPVQLWTAILLTQSGATYGAAATFQLDPARSAIAMSGTIVALNQPIPFVEQAPGSLRANYSGPLQVDLQADTVQFVDGSVFSPAEVNPWKPAALGADGSALASYGAKASLQISVFVANAVAASRGLVFLGGSPVLPMSSGTFPMGGFVTQFKEGTNAVVDYRVSGAVSLSGSKALGGYLTNRVSTLGALTNIAGIQTLILPVKASYSFNLESTIGPVTYNLTFDGQLVATEAKVVPQPLVAFTPIASPGGPLILSFATELFKLQRSTELNPSAWQDVAGPSPVSIPTSKPGEYFRVVPK
jgi:hypothetical protein